VPFRKLILSMFGRRTAESASREHTTYTTEKTLGQKLAEQGKTREEAYAELLEYYKKNRGMAPDFAKLHAERSLRDEFDPHVKK